MRISDLSSDVCSSDLVRTGGVEGEVLAADGEAEVLVEPLVGQDVEQDDQCGERRPADLLGHRRTAALEASGPLVVNGGGDRKPGGEGKCVSVSLDLGGRRITKK